MQGGDQTTEGVWNNQMEQAQSASRKRAKIAIFVVALAHKATKEDRARTNSELGEGGAGNVITEPWG